MKIFYLRNETTNLGDAIQSLAARYLILSSGHEPIPIVKEELMKCEENQPGPLSTEKYLINGWFTKHEFNTLIKRIGGNTNGIIAGVHISDWYDEKHTNEAINQSNLELKIGCRDSATFKQIINIHSKSWISGCLTTTLGITFKPNIITKSDNKCKALFVDIKSCRCLSKKIESHNFTHSNGSIQTEAKAERSLNLFSNYKFIITRRLHCALPSCSFGKLVLFFGNIKDYRIEPILLSGSTIRRYPSYRNEKLIVLRVLHLMQRKLSNLSRCRSVSKWIYLSLKGKYATPTANKILYNEIINQILCLEE